MWQQQADLIRKWSIIATTEAASGHPTSCMSAADIAAVLFDKYFTYDIKKPLNIYNDRFVLSKGHAAPLLYTVFAMAGAYKLEDLKTLRKDGSIFEGHPVPKFVYTEAATGSLGQGLSVGAGLALAAKRENRNCKIYVLTGDGELAEGQVWEAANFASFYKLNNLIAILDINRLAQSGETMFGHDVKKYADRFAAFGFETIVIDGHDFKEIDNALNTAVNNETDRPVAIIAKTKKGKGVSFTEDKDGWHGKAFKKEDMQKVLKELSDADDKLTFRFKKPLDANGAASTTAAPATDIKFDPAKEYATREVFGEVLAALGRQNKNIYALDGDVKNSTFTEKYLDAIPERFVECYIAEQNMVSVAAGLSRIGKIPVVATFGAFLTRAADQIRMARISEANIKFVGSHVGVSIGEDGASQMALEDIALFGAMPDTIILQPADAIATSKLLPLMLTHNGFAYMRTLRPKTKIIYNAQQQFTIGGSAILRKSNDDALTIAATGITVFEALQAADELEEEGIHVRVVDIYSINPVDKATLIQCLQETQQQALLTVEDHFMHGGMGDFAVAAVTGIAHRIEKLAVKNIAHSGAKDELLKHAGIDASAIKQKVKELMNIKRTVGV